MKLSFPSKEFNEAVAAVCRGEASDAESLALNALLRSHAAARDEYILRVEIHSRLASEPEMFVSVARDEAQALFSGTCAVDPQAVIAFPTPAPAKKRKRTWALALAACFAVLAAGIWETRARRPMDSKAVVAQAVAILNRTVDAKWSPSGDIPQVGTRMQPGRFELRSGLAQFIFYSGARVLIEGPAQIEFASPDEVTCLAGRLMVEVPSPAQTFHVRTPHVEVSGLAASMGLHVQGSGTELQVFKGDAEVSTATRGVSQKLAAGTGGVTQGSRPLRIIPGNPAGFASLLAVQTKSVAAEKRRYVQWHAASSSLNHDPSLVVHIDFEGIANHPRAHLRDLAGRGTASSESIVGGQMVSGRWADKAGLEFQSLDDCVRLNVPGEFNALTLSAWVRVQGLDRQVNSLFMCDGFDPGEIHWMIVNDGALALTVKGSNRGHFQAIRSPPVISPDLFGTWVHLVVVLDGNGKRVTHYLNGRVVSEQTLALGPPFRIGTAELGNWNAADMPTDDQEIWIRNFNGAMDEFCMFSRALTDTEIQELYLEGNPEAAY